MIRCFIAPLIWAYDFLAEDLVLVVGTAIAIGVGILAVHITKNAAGIILYGALVAVIAASLWRAAASGRG